LKINREDKENPANNLCVKVKFFAMAAPEEGEDQTYRLKFTKKRGNLMDWYQIFDEMKEFTLDESMTETANTAELPAEDVAA